MEENESLPLELGEFEIIRRIGQGVMGEVYEAQQESLNRRVALKTLSHGLGLTAKGIRRFKQHMHSATKLQHRHIVTVYASGELGLVPYYAMELVEGPSLDRIVRQLRAWQVAARHPEAVSDSDLAGKECPAWALSVFLDIPPETTHSAEGPQAGNTLAPQVGTQDTQALNLVPTSVATRFEVMADKIADLAEAVAYAHSQGVLHLDIKPSNLLMSPDGRLMINDFALARALEEPGLTLSGEFTGSAYHMSPEQVVPNHHPVDERSDIYSLGVVLYELMTLHLPFDGPTRPAIQEQIMHADVKSPRRIEPAIPQDLETICLKALDKVPNQRYQSADQLANDLRRFVDHQGISAAQIGTFRQSARWCRRHWAVSSGVALVLVVASLLGVLGYQRWQQWSAWRDRILASTVSRATLDSLAGDEAPLQNKLQLAAELGMDPWISHLLLGQQRLFSGRPALAVEALEQAAELKPSNLQIRTVQEQALVESNNWEEAWALRKKIWKAEPTTNRDQLYLASWWSRYEPTRGLRIAEDAYLDMERGERALTLLHLADARWRAAQDTGDVDASELAVRDSRFVTELLRPNSYARLIHFEALKVAGLILKNNGRQADAVELETNAEEVLQAIDKSFPASLAAARAWGWQACSLDDSEKRLSAFQKSLGLHEKLFMTVANELRTAHILELYFQERLAEARAELELLPDGFEPAAALQVLLWTEEEEEAKGIEKALQAIRQFQPLGSDKIWYQPLGALFLGQPDEARQLFQLLKLPSEISGEAVGTFADLQKLLACGAGTLSIDELLSESSLAVHSNIRLADMQFLAGMQLFAAGQRTDAQEHFQLCLRAGVVTEPAYQFSRLILKKWESDSDWPPWIVKEW